MMNFSKIFDNNGIIAEIKFASPSEGQIYRGDFDHVAIARSYLQNGASALSVLTEEKYFEGSLDYIREIRREFPNALILRKDFILHKEQITEAFNYGANAVLLIVAFLNETQLKDLYEYAISLNLTPLVEVNNLQELDIALQLNPEVIGINNRNLKTFKVDLDLSRQLVKFIPEGINIVCASGIQNHQQLQEMRALGFKGFLIGTRLMKQNDPGIALRELLHDES